MILKNIKKSILIFMFFSSLLAGLVFFGVLSSFSLMLFENGFNSSNISIILLATFPYSWKFFITPYINNILFRYCNINIIKLLLIIIQLAIFILFSSLGIYSLYINTFLATLHIFLLVLMISIHDILCTHVKLTNFENKEYGVVAATSNVGFRIGMLVGGGGLLYFSQIFNWSLSFVFSIFFVILLSVTSTIFLPKLSISNIILNKKIINIKDLFKLLLNFVHKHYFWLLMIIIISIKAPDSSINSTKTLFLSYKGFDKITIANISQIPGVFSMILGGFIAGIVTYKFNIIKCLKYALIIQFIICIMFIYLSYNNANVYITMFILTLASLGFGYTNILYRTFIDNQSHKDVNINILFGSIGSLCRTIFSSLSLIIIEQNNWQNLYLYCVIFTISGIIVLYNSQKFNNSSIYLTKF